ncbi:MAG: hypothetical protein AAGG07_01640 [Planctomycetota bacterium]
MLNIIGALLATVLAIALLIFGVYYGFRLLGLIFRGIGAVILHLARFVGGMVGDTARFIGAIIVAIVMVPLVIANVVIGRWSAAGHFGRAFQHEVTTAGACLYRVAIGHPLRLLMLHGVTEGLERRVPAIVAEAPTRDGPSKATGKYDGYKIAGSLKGGGSGGKLYIAEPDEVKRAAFERAGQSDVDRVVIKAFSLGDGSSLPQIVRESRALDSAKKLGLVLEHDLNDQRFFYVMRYVPGDSLGTVIRNMHAASEESGLDDRRLREGLSYVGDLLETLDAYHRGGLWHKDVKPDNIIVHDGQAHVVDLGLVTPLRSAMTLTTHGTEYFRDPELVRMALRGVKVHQVDGAKFDVYAAGAVLYCLLENEFPAHGGLSQVRKRCPEALRWVIRRSMAEYDQRYSNAAMMLEDLRAVGAAEDPYLLRAADLPSMRVGKPIPELDEPEPFVAPLPQTPAVPRPADAAKTPAVPPVPPAAVAGVQAEADAAPRRAPKIDVAGWWSGRYEVREGPDAPRRPRARAERRGAPTPRKTPPTPPTPKPVRPREERRPAHEQLEAARARADEIRQRAADRRGSPRRRKGAPRKDNTHGGHGVGVAVAITIVGVILGVRFMHDRGSTTVTKVEQHHEATVDAKEPSPDPASRAAALADALTRLEREIGAIEPASVSSELIAVQERLMSRLASMRDKLEEAQVSAAAAPITDRSVLLINDFSEPLDPEFRDAVASFTAQLEREKIDPLIGEIAADLEAKAVLLRAQRQLGSAELGFALRRWVAAEQDVDLLVWFEPGATDQGVEVRYGLYGPRSSAVAQGGIEAIARTASGKAIEFAGR